MTAPLSPEERAARKAEREELTQAVAAWRHTRYITGRPLSRLRQDVLDAAEALQSEGTFPTLDAIQARIGRGCKSRISKARGELVAAGLLIYRVPPPDKGGRPTRGVRRTKPLGTVREARARYEAAARRAAEIRQVATDRARADETAWFAALPPGHFVLRADLVRSGEPIRDAAVKAEMARVREEGLAEMRREARTKAKAVRTEARTAGYAGTTLDALRDFRRASRSIKV